MKKFFVLLMCVMAVLASAQDNKVVRKIKIQHADPMLIALLLSGRQNFQMPSEISKALQMNGGNFGNNQNGNQGNNKNRPGK